MDWFLRGLNLAHGLFTAKALRTYKDELPVTLTNLGVKALNDILASVLLVRNGYHFQS